MAAVAQVPFANRSLDVTDQSNQETGVLFYETLEAGKKLLVGIEKGPTFSQKKSLNVAVNETLVRFASLILFQNSD